MVVKRFIAPFSRAFRNIETDGVYGTIHLRPKSIILMARELRRRSIDLSCITSCHMPDFQTLKPKWHDLPSLSSSLLCPIIYYQLPALPPPTISYQPSAICS